MIAAMLAGLSRAICGTTVVWQCDARAARQRVYFGNHASHLDFVLIWSAFPADVRRTLRPVAGSDYWTGPVRRYLAEEVFHAVLIERAAGRSSDGAAAAAAAIHRMVDHMGDRHSLIVFPEGTRSLGGEPGPFKSGLFHLSRLRPDVELVPVYLDNLNRILPKGEILPVPMLSRIVFGAPLAPNAREDKSAFLARARGALLDLKGIH
jgi:1-acyl-sn-glycerol-3-phosphate acyltransferase